MNFNDELLNVVDFDFVQKVIDKANISKVLDKIDTQEFASRLKEEAEDNSDELRDNIMEIFFERVREEMVCLVMDRIESKYVVDITERFSETLKISGFDENKTLRQVRDEVYELVEEKIFDKVFDQVSKKLDEKFDRECETLHKTLDKIVEIAETWLHRV